MSDDSETVFIAPSRYRSGEVFHTDQSCEYLENTDPRPVDRDALPHRRECEVCESGKGIPSEQDGNYYAAALDADPAEVFGR
jgi:hypothetical protein